MVRIVRQRLIRVQHALIRVQYTEAPGRTSQHSSEPRVGSDHERQPLAHGLHRGRAREEGDGRHGPAVRHHAALLLQESDGASLRGHLVRRDFRHADSVTCLRGGRLADACRGPHTPQAGPPPRARLARRRGHFERV
eukprot:scaffold40368_cov59-Phaeocystis_antarctica.AAC.3